MIAFLLACLYIIAALAINASIVYCALAFLARDMEREAKRVLR